MQLVIVSNGLRVISRGTTDGNALGLFGADETVRSLCRDELMAEVGGGMEEDAGRGGDPSIGRRRHGPKSRRRHGPKSFWTCQGCACFIVYKTCDCLLSCVRPEDERIILRTI